MDFFKCLGETVLKFNDAAAITKQIAALIKP